MCYQMHTFVHSPQSMQHAVAVKFHKCKGTSAFPINYSVFRQTWPPFLMGRKGMKVPRQCKQTRGGIHMGSPDVTPVITLNKQTLSPPVHEAFRTWTLKKNSGVSEHLGQHGILYLSGNTGYLCLPLSLSLTLAKTYTNALTHTL